MMTLVKHIVLNAFFEFVAECVDEEEARLIVEPNGFIYKRTAIRRVKKDGTIITLIKEEPLD